MAEVQALKQERGDTEEARKVAEEQIEKMKKDHEEKVSISVPTFCCCCRRFLCPDRMINIINLMNKFLTGKNT